MGLLMFECEFEMCDNTTEIEVNGVVPKMVEFLENVRKEKWFVEGNRTEGIVTWCGGDSVNVSWKTINLDDDCFTDTKDYEVEVGINHPCWSNVFGVTELN